MLDGWDNGAFLRTLQAIIPAVPIAVLPSPYAGVLPDWTKLARHYLPQLENQFPFIRPTVQNVETALIRHFGGGATLDEVESAMLDGWDNGAFLRTLQAIIPAVPIAVLPSPAAGLLSPAVILSPTAGMRPDWLKQLALFYLPRLQAQFPHLRPTVQDVQIALIQHFGEGFVDVESRLQDWDSGTFIEELERVTGRPAVPVAASPSPAPGAILPSRAPGKPRAKKSVVAAAAPSPPAGTPGKLSRVRAAAAEEVMTPELWTAASQYYLPQLVKEFPQVGSSLTVRDVFQALTQHFPGENVTESEVESALFDGWDGGAFIDVLERVTGLPVWPAVPSPAPAATRPSVVVTTPQWRDTLLKGLYGIGMQNLLPDLQAVIMQATPEQLAAWDQVGKAIYEQQQLYRGA
jgi:hypothetical protein